MPENEKSKALQEMLENRSNAMPKNITSICDWYIKEAKNAIIIDTDGKKYIDFSAGIGVLNVGHSHPKIVEAIKNQAEKFTHTAFGLTPYLNCVSLAQKLNDLMPFNENAKTYFFSSGAEAVENAIKVAKAITNRYGVISFGGSFHGRTAMALALTGKSTPYKSHLGVGMPGVYHALYPSKVHDISTKEALKSIENIMKFSIPPSDVAAIIFECIQGEGGFNVATNDFLQGIKEICDKYKIILIDDEIQCGFARTGKMFAIEHFDIKPDIICMAKSLGAGIPISAISAKASILDSLPAGTIGGTFAGNPLGIAAGLEVLEIIKNEDLCSRSMMLGEHLLKELNTFKDENNIEEMLDIRGIGSMIGVEFAIRPKNAKNYNENDTIAKKVQSIAMQKGVLSLTCGSANEAIRFLYPLTIEMDVFKEGIKIMLDSIKEAVGR